MTFISLEKNPVTLAKILAITAGMDPDLPLAEQFGMRGKRFFGKAGRVGSLLLNARVSFLAPRVPVR
jgi:hypothetical protein